MWRFTPILIIVYSVLNVCVGASTSGNAQIRALLRQVLVWANTIQNITVQASSGVNGL